MEGYGRTKIIGEYTSEKKTKNDAHKCPVSVVFSKALTIPLGDFMYIV